MKKYIEIMPKPRLLITRFAPHAKRLADLLNEQGIYSLAQPLLEIKAVASSLYPFHKKYDDIIAISANAVEYTDRVLKGEQWPLARYLAVGESTKSLLAQKVGQSVFLPCETFNSEGLLALSQLQQLKNRSILILRGVGGREFLKEELIARGASVDYYESYQRVAINFSRSTSIQKWQQLAINGAIISSVELLEQLIIVAKDDKNWLLSLTIFTASERILEHAIALGFQKTELLPSISNQKIIDYFTDEGSYDRY
ncbi:uroporphyrinogen-III synthase [Psychromonas sp. Urea-02u-13]|uniref:uroporphyrinogen-III synthase n=1 Tax=Psychromonas sp. Urea-02u-13 TaxID=2058326 RepID=UPI001E5A6D64|nr:uroporphyrinogen-III synthase [Psychromonas sp. Urea-02u-13]